VASETTCPFCQNVFSAEDVRGLRTCPRCGKKASQDGRSLPGHETRSSQDVPDIKLRRSMPTPAVLLALLVVFGLASIALASALKSDQSVVVRLLLAANAFGLLVLCLVAFFVIRTAGRSNPEELRRAANFGCATVGGGVFFLVVLVAAVWATALFMFAVCSSGQ
jgi:hypothetical protein